MARGSMTNPRLIGALLSQIKLIRAVAALHAVCTVRRCPIQSIRGASLRDKQTHKHKLFYFFGLFFYFVSASLPPRLQLVVRWAFVQNGHTHSVNTQGVEGCTKV